MNGNNKYIQVINLFSNPKTTMFGGLWFSGIKREGEYKRWYDNGQLAEHCFYKDDKREGELKEWHRNGLLYRCFFYKNGKREGEYREWRNNGQLQDHCFYKHDKEYTIEQAKELFPEGPWI